MTDISDGAMKQEGLRRQNLLIIVVRCSVTNNIHKQETGVPEYLSLPILSPVCDMQTHRPTHIPIYFSPSKGALPGILNPPSLPAPAHASLHMHAQKPKHRTSKHASVVYIYSPSTQSYTPGQLPSRCRRCVSFSTLRRCRLRLGLAGIGFLNSLKRARSRGRCREVGSDDGRKRKGAGTVRQVI